jgi:thiosulfate/3-mercaptopyruvate sulfurtransferase
MKRKGKVIGLILGVTWAWFAGLNVNAAQFVNPQYLIDSKTLTAKMGQPDLVIVDVRAPEAYELGHIKGATNIPVKSTQGTVKGVKEMMRPVAELEKLLGSKGVSSDAYVVLYDENVQDYSTLFFWTLDALGHKKMAVLDGGISKWAKEGLPVVSEETRLAPTKYTAQYDPSKVATLEEVKKSLERKEVVLVDTRAPKEFTGETPGRDVGRGGHLKGAVNLDWTNHATTKDGFKVYKSADELLSMYENAKVTKDKEVLVYCRTGLRCTNTYFVLKLLGYPKVKSYDASMIEWSNIPDLPVETGK